MNQLDKLKQDILESLFKKHDEHDVVINSKQYVDLKQFSHRYTFDFIKALRTISVYSTRWKEYYDESLVIHSIDDCIQSAISIKFQMENGIFNPAKRELRYIIELILKALYVDQVKGKAPLTEKIAFLHTDVHRSSIDLVDQINLPFQQTEKKEFLNDLSLYYSNICEYVHPSKKQIDEQVLNYERDNTIGFESTKMLENVVNLTFRVYDIVLSLFFIGFGPSMSTDVYEGFFKDDPKWKFHKGKHTKRYLTLLTSQ